MATMVSPPTTLPTMIPINAPVDNDDDDDDDGDVDVDVVVLITHVNLPC